MLVYEVIIEGPEVEEIKLVNKEIDSVEVKLDSEKDHAFDRANDMVGQIRIKGSILPEGKTKTKNLFKWTLDTEKAKVYRTVTVQIKEDEYNLLREYKFDNAFVVDYTEEFGTGGKETRDNGKYEILISQRQVNLDQIQIYDN